VAEGNDSGSPTSFIPWLGSKSQRLCAGEDSYFPKGRGDRTFLSMTSKKEFYLFLADLLS